MGSTLVGGSITGTPRLGSDAVRPTSQAAVVPEPGAHNVGRWAMAGAVIGFASAAIVIGLIAFFWGLDAGGSLGLGLYVGGFGGAGFGFMLGGMLALPAETRPKRQ